MAQTFKANIVGYNATTQESKEQGFTVSPSIRSYIVTAASNAQMYANGARSFFIYPPASAATNIGINYYCEETLDELITAMNEVTVVALDSATTLTIGTDLHFVKEVDHVIDVNTTTTAATAGGAITVKGGTGATSGAGGAVSITGGTAGATAASVGGAVTIKSGVSGAGNGASGVLTLESGASTAAATGAVVLRSGIPATSGASGTLTLATGSVTTANSGALSIFTGVSVTGNSGIFTLGTGATTTGNSSNITISTGNAGTGNSGDIILTPGTASAVVGKIKTSAGIVQNHNTVAANSTATLTAKQVATGYITSTSASATGLTLPTGTALGSELGATQGTIFDLTVDNTGGSSTVTMIVSVNGILSAMAAANAASSGLLTIPSGVTGQGTFRLMFSSSTAFTFTRIA